MIEISEELAQNGGLCPVCGRMFRPKGLGPDTWQTISTILDNLPSSHLLRWGANYHDWVYHLGPNWGTRLEADELFLKKNQEIIAKKCTWYDRWFYETMNYRNYFFVRKFGQSFWGKDGCKKSIEIKDKTS